MESYRGRSNLITFQRGKERFEESRVMDVLREWKEGKGEGRKKKERERKKKKTDQLSPACPTKMRRCKTTGKCRDYCGKEKGNKWAKLAKLNVVAKKKNKRKSEVEGKKRRKAKKMSVSRRKKLYHWKEQEILD